MTKLTAALLSAVISCSLSACVITAENTPDSGTEPEQDTVMTDSLPTDDTEPDSETASETLPETAAETAEPASSAGITEPAVKEGPETADTEAAEPVGETDTTEETTGMTGTTGTTGTDEPSDITESIDSGREQVTVLDGLWRYTDNMHGGGPYVIFLAEKHGMYAAMNSDFLIDMFDMYGGTNVDIEKVSGDSDKEVWLAVRKEDGLKCLYFADNEGFNITLLEDYYTKVDITDGKIFTVGSSEDDYIAYEITEEDTAVFGEGEESFEMKRNTSYDHLLDYIIKYFD